MGTQHKDSKLLCLIKNYYNLTKTCSCVIPHHHFSISLSSSVLKQRTCYHLWVLLFSLINIIQNRQCRTLDNTPGHSLLILLHIHGEHLIVLHISRKKFYMKPHCSGTLLAPDMKSAFCERKPAILLRFTEYSCNLLNVSYTGFVVVSFGLES